MSKADEIRAQAVRHCLADGAGVLYYLVPNDRGGFTMGAHDVDADENVGMLISYPTRSAADVAFNRLERAVKAGESDAAP